MEERWEEHWNKIEFRKNSFSDFDIISGNPIKQLAQFEESKQMQISEGSDESAKPK